MIIQKKIRIHVGNIPQKGLFLLLKVFTRILAIFTRIIGFREFQFLGQFLTMSIVLKIIVQLSLFVNGCRCPHRYKNKVNKFVCQLSNENTEFKFILFMTSVR